MVVKSLNIVPTSFAGLHNMVWTSVDKLLSICKNNRHMLNWTLLSPIWKDREKTKRFVLGYIKIFSVIFGR